jgi:hypothetical protein
MTWVVANLVSVYLEIVLVLVQDRCTVCTESTISFWTHLMELLGDWVMSNLVLVCLETVLVLV